MKIGCDPVPLYSFLKTMEFDLLEVYHLCYDSHTQTSGGICLFINRQTNNIKIFGIGEDDGYMFPELNSL